MTNYMSNYASDHTEEEIAADVEAARELLARHGMVARIVGPADVQIRLAKMNGTPGAGRCINPGEAVKHAVEGDDWKNLEEETVNDDSMIWAIIDGTKGDHPEWFAD